MARPNIQNILPSPALSMGPPEDLEEGPKRPTGYEGLAQFMGVYPELAIFRRFGALNLQNVLFLQAEITALEEIYSEVAANQPHYPEFSEEWYEKVKRGDVSPDGQDRGGRDFDNPSGRYKLVLRLRKLLNEYNNALLQQGSILALQPPARNDLHFLRKWLTTPELGANFLPPRDSATWDNYSILDLVTLRPRSESDKRFSKRATDYLIALFRRVFRRRRLFGGDELIPGLVDYQASSLLLFMQIATAILSSLLLMVSVVVLYFVHAPGARLGIIGAFTVIFSLGLALFGGANRNEIFGATAACIAVQIVFVGTN